MFLVIANFLAASAARQRAAATRKSTNTRSYLLRPTNAAKAAFVRGAACGKAPPTPPPFSSCAGGEAPSTRCEGGRCRRGERPLTRGGSRKKIGYNEKHTRQWILQKSIGSQQFSCTYRCAPRRSRPPSALPAVVFRSRGLRPLDPHRCRKGNVGSLTPLNCNLNARATGRVYPESPQTKRDTRRPRPGLVSRILYHIRWAEPPPQCPRR